EARHSNGAVAHQLPQPCLTAQIDPGADKVGHQEGERHGKADEKQQRGPTEKQPRGKDPGAHAADTASERGSLGPCASRPMRNANSMASSANATGRGAITHHSGMTTLLIWIA